MANETPTIQELLEKVEQRKRQLASCCGICHHCRASKKILAAYDQYERTRISEWPDEIPVCDKCGSMENVGKWGMGQTDVIFDLCEKCEQDHEGFIEWLANEIKDALDNSGLYEKLPNGKYRPIAEENNGKSDAEHSCPSRLLGND